MRGLRVMVGGGPTRPPPTKENDMSETTSDPREFESRIMQNEPPLVFGTVEEARAWIAAQNARIAADIAGAAARAVTED